jgi:transposase
LLIARRPNHVFLPCRRPRRIHRRARTRRPSTDRPDPKPVYHYFTVWAADGTLSRIHGTLREQVRVAEGRQPVPTAGLINAQSLRAAETVGSRSSQLRGTFYM